MLDAKQLREVARAAGADVFGVADVARFDELPPPKRPTVIFPEARSVVVLGRRIPRGAVRGVEEGTNFTNYALYGVDWLDNRFTSLTTIRVAEHLEDDGWEAVPIPNLPPEVPPMGVAVRPGAPEPNIMLDLDDAAVRAGVGEIGYPDVLLTPRFGPRQRIQMILTDAEIEPSPILADPIWPEGNRGEGFCPLGAIGRPTERVICGKRMTVAAIDYARCRECKNGARPNHLHPSGRPDRLAAVCIRSAIALLEREGRLADRFATPLRVRAPWTVPADFDPYRT